MICALAMLSSAFARADALESVYTDLGEKACKTLKPSGEPEEGPTLVCGGVGGYRLKVVEGDLRQSVNVIDPKGKENSLEYWSVITGGFSMVGPKAEWRVEKNGAKVTPKALIVRVNASEDAANPNKKTSYLAVAKITPEKICVTDRIAPSADQNEKARSAADASTAKPCLSHIP